MIDVLPLLITVFGSFIGIIVVVLAYAAYTDNKEKQHELALAQLKSNSSEKEPAEKEIIKEIVMIPCAYCGSLTPQTALFCGNCGAKRKA